MGALSSVENKSASSRKSRSAEEPRRNGLLVVVSPSEAASTPSSPNRDASLLRSRSRSSDAGLPALAAEARDADSDVDGRGESNGLRSTTYCSADDQQRSHDDAEEKQGDDRAKKSSDHDVSITPGAASPPASS